MLIWARTLPGTGVTLSTYCKVVPWSLPWLFVLLLQVWSNSLYSSRRHLKYDKQNKPRTFARGLQNDQECWGYWIFVQMDV